MTLHAEYVSCRAEPDLFLTFPALCVYGTTMSRNRIAVSAIFAVLLSGCGTVFNFAGGNPQPYGGVAKDVEFAAAYQAALQDKPPRQQTGVSGHSPLALACLLGLYYGDFGASAIADTLTLPVILVGASRSTSDIPVRSEDF